MNDYSNAVQEVHNGNADPIEVYAQLKSEIDYLQKMKDEIESYALKEIDKFDKKFQYKGFSIERREGRRMFCFDNISSWKEKNKELKEIESAAKAAYSNSQKNFTTVTSEGEIVDLPTVKFSKESIIIKKI